MILRGDAPKILDTLIDFYTRDGEACYSGLGTGLTETQVEELWLRLKSQFSPNVSLDIHDALLKVGVCAILVAGSRLDQPPTTMEILSTIDELVTVLKDGVRRGDFAEIRERASSLRAASFSTGGTA